ncbi:hypothetical protein D3C87_1640220 [compost metagenome]
MTLVVTRPANSSEKNDRLCRSIMRWKSQRRRSGRLMARIWCCTTVRRLTRTMLASSTRPIPHSTWRSCADAGSPTCQTVSRSTICPRKANSQAS